MVSTIHHDHHDYGCHCFVIRKDIEAGKIRGHHHHIDVDSFSRNPLYDEPWRIPRVTGFTGLANIYTSQVTYWDSDTESLSSVDTTEPPYIFK